MVRKFDPISIYYCIQCLQCPIIPIVFDTRVQLSDCAVLVDTLQLQKSKRMVRGLSTRFNSELFLTKNKRNELNIHKIVVVHRARDLHLSFLCLSNHFSENVAREKRR